MDSLIERKQYMQQLRNLKDQNLIKVISGVRRCGKSTLLQMFADELLTNGVVSTQIQFLNFEDLDTLALGDIFEIHTHIKKRLVEDKMNYIFFNLNYIDFDTRGYDFEFKNKPVLNYSAQAQFILPWEIKNTMSYFLTPKGTYEIYQIIKPIHQFDISFNKDFLNKNLMIGLHCFDVFNINEVNALVSSTNLRTKFYQKPDSRTFRISLTYNFGNLKLEKENTDINTEKVKSGGGMIK